MELLIGLLSAGSIAVAAWWLVHCAFKLDQQNTLKPAQKPNDNWLEERLKADLDAKRKANKVEQTDWNNQFTMLVQTTCKHKYDMHAMKWWVCTECCYEKPWYWDDECDCRYEWDQRLTSHIMNRVLLSRSGTCKVHGRDFEQYKAEAAESFNKNMESMLQLKATMNELQKQYSKGGITN